MKNLQVVDPTISTLTVRWEPAVGNVRTYKVFYAAQPGGEERMVGSSSVSCDAPRLYLPLHPQLHLCELQPCALSPLLDEVVVVLTEVLTFYCTGGGVRRHHQHHPEELGRRHRLRCGGRPRVPGRGGHTAGREGKDK